MTAFQDAARAKARDEAIENYPWEFESTPEAWNDGFMEGATWARRYEAGRKVTDAEVLAAHRAWLESQMGRPITAGEWGRLYSNRDITAIEATLTAARTVRLAEMEGE